MMNLKNLELNNQKENSTSYFKYDNSEAEWNKVLDDPERKKIGDTWFRKDTVDSWRHARMRAPLLPFVTSNKNLSWLTIGDGRYGTDANFLLNSGAKNVHCTDISDALLKIGNEKGLINTYSEQNAESLNFSDSSYDFVYCKEAFHHFPRPYIALYEMFRVCKKAVIITEPRDAISDRTNFSFIFYFIKRFLRKGNYEHSFEQVGNYVYSISEREIDKFLLGMNYTFVAYNGCNDAYVPGVEFIPLDTNKFSEKLIKFKIFTKIRLMDFLCNLGIMKTGLVTAALFKQEPSDELLNLLRSNGWSIRRLPKNPFAVIS
jgi:ubiquinone/menaquinone biosynthesis C-methylase UbiE